MAIRLREGRARLVGPEPEVEEHDLGGWVIVGYRETDSVCLGCFLHEEEARHAAMLFEEHLEGYVRIGVEQFEGRLVGDGKVKREA